MKILRFPVALAVMLGCGPKPATEAPDPKPHIEEGRVPPEEMTVPPSSPATPPEMEDTFKPMVPPEAAYAHGWMPVSSTGVDRFLERHPTYDGRGVIIGILDTGIDPRIPGLGKTTTDDPKALDLRDFSGEGSVQLEPVIPDGDTVVIGGKRLAGFGRVRAVNTAGPYYGGTIREIPLGPAPASDLNGNGRDSDTLALVVTRATDGWVLLADLDGDGSLAGERPVHDYLVARETFAWATPGRTPRINLVANFAGVAPPAEPRLDLLFDISSHGSHVAGIAAGNDLYGVAGFDGVAPGAQILGLKIANSAQGSVTTTGSMLRAIDYAIRFAAARRMPLVLNLSFGVGNEIEGGARIDAMIDSVLAANPGLVFTISAGNDGPGISTLGFPGSAYRAISVGAMIPSSFLPPEPSGRPRDEQLAYFSSRGGELAKPDLVTPGVAYSTVPRWSTGQEITQGTSMAAPHAAGLVALLVSGLVQEKRPIVAAAIKQALMVTARPIRGETYIDEGTGVPELEQAFLWLRDNRRVPDIAVRTRSGASWTSAALHYRRVTEPRLVQQFEVLRPATATQAVYALRSNASWVKAPGRVTLTGPRTTIDVQYNTSELRSPGAHIGIVTAWSADTMLGPVFRLVSTILAPEPMNWGVRELRTNVPVEPGARLRTFFRADSARPVEVRLRSAGANQKGLAFLHEPDGMPYRDESARLFGSGEQEAIYQIDGRDVVSGTYEAVAVAAPAEPVNVTLRVTYSPLRLQLGRTRNGATGVVTNVESAPVSPEISMLLAGGERVETIVAQGSAVRRIPFVAPAWAKAVIVDLAMDRAQWGRFTDFGVTLFDSVGRQIEKKPLNYAFGRLQAELPEGHGDMPVELGLFPGFADPTTGEGWTARVSIRLYADSAVALTRRSGPASSFTLAPGATLRSDFELPSAPWPLGDGFFPLGVLMARVGEQSWTREGGLPPPNPPIMR